MRFQLPARSVFTPKAAPKWQTRERLTRIPVWDSGLLLKGLGWGGRDLLARCSTTQDGRILELSIGANAVPVHEPQACYVSFCPDSFCPDSCAGSVGVLVYVLGRYRSVTGKICGRGSGEEGGGSIGTHTRSMQVQMQRNLRRSEDSEEQLP